MTENLYVDLFAGGGGWDIAARELGLAPLVGVELDKQACATRAAAGLHTIRADVSKLPRGPFVGKVRGGIISPPCQDFSPAGLGAGLSSGRGQLVWQAEHWIREVRPRWVACEQVPDVLPIWRAIADRIRPLGYKARTFLVGAHRFGLPQTRTRAILLASLDYLPAMPIPSEEPPMSMADALGWPPGYTIRTRGQMDPNKGGNVFSADGPSWTVTSTARSWIVEPEGRELTIAEVSILQGFPVDHPWRGSRTSQFRQCANAIPPQLAKHLILAAARLEMAEVAA